VASGVGGILRLGRLIDERWDALEADFADRGIDLAHALWVDQIGVRKFRVLVDGLPASARLWHEEHGGWTITDHHLATVAMQTNSVYRQLLAMAGMKKHEIPPPLVIRRPGPKPKPNSWTKEWASKASGR
jgi:hypothetical protein